jgi:hypothetical protein
MIQIQEAHKHTIRIRIRNTGLKDLEGWKPFPGAWSSFMEALKGHGNEADFLGV